MFASRLRHLKKIDVTLLTMYLSNISNQTLMFDFKKDTRY